MFTKEEPIRRRLSHTIEKGNHVKEWKWTEGKIIGGFVIASGLILFFNLWGRSLENHGYLRYAEVAREMIQSGDWVIPRLNGDIYIDKPPFLFWLIAIPSSVHGSVTPFIARLPGALFAWMGVILLFLWGKRAYGTVQSGLLSGGILLTTYEYFFQARLAKTDSVLCVLVILSLYSFYLGYGASGRKRYLFHGLSFFSMGLAVLTKGPIGLFIPLLVISIFLFKERRWGLWVSKEFILGYVIVGLVVLPWVFLFIDRVGFDRAITLMKENQILTRTAPIYFYFVQIWGDFFPWSIFLPFVSVSVWRQREQIWHSEKSLFLIWFIALFIALTLFKYRVSRYLLPALPPLALIAGGLWRYRLSSFLIPFLLSVFIWHGVEFHWVAKDFSNSPGMVLSGELRPLIGDSTLFGYRLGESTVEEVNFYLSRVIPILKETESLTEQLRRSGRGLVLMPEEVYKEVLKQEEDSIVFVRGFPYKKGRLVMVSMNEQDETKR